MAEDWSREEVAATVADYFTMLGYELRGEPYNKREHNRRLQPMLNNRSQGAVEFKHQNISAVLIELGFPYLEGYKPRGNYQELLKAEVEHRLEGDAALAEAAGRLVTAPHPPVLAIVPLGDVLVPAPVRNTDGTYERRVPSATVLTKINYLEREAQNSSLGLAGELFALGIEHRRLWDAGQHRLAERIEHVSNTQGDGLGFDIRSFEVDGRESLIEVKTTSFGQMTPFFASAKEVRVSEERSESYKLYRVFKFRQTPRLFILPGSLRESCVLDPVQFRASLT